MKFYILASVILFGFVIFRAGKRSERLTKQAEREFWAREEAANQVRRKPIDHLPYIQIPMERFPTTLLKDDNSVQEKIEILRALSEQKILNLTGFTNTDLKLEYGTATITELSEYDQNYTLLVRTLQGWADALYEAGYKEEASVIMEFAIETGTDISKTYFLLAEYWFQKGEPGRIQYLLEVANTLRSSNKDFIVRRLTESYL